MFKVLLETMNIILLSTCAGHPCNQGTVLLDEDGNLSRLVRPIVSNLLKDSNWSANELHVIYSLVHSLHSAVLPNIVRRGVACGISSSLRP